MRNPCAASSCALYLCLLCSLAVGAQGQSSPLSTLTLEEADGTASSNQIRLIFSSPLLVNTATNLANYIVTNLLGSTLPISDVQVLNPTNILLSTSTPRLRGNNYLVLAQGLQDSSTNIISTNNIAPVSTTLTLLDEQSFWYVYNPAWWYGDDPDLGAAWRQPNYEPYSAVNANVGWGDNSFNPGAFWYGTTNIPAALGVQLVQGEVPIFYFRSQIHFPGSPLGSSLSLTHLIKDAAVFFLNGQEASRFNMPAGPISWNTLASSELPIAWRDSNDFPKLASGTNTVCVEMHTAQTNFSRAVFALRLQARISSLGSGPVIITRQPSSQAVGEGYDVTFSFQGAGPARFQWFENGTAIASATNETLTLHSLSNGLNGHLYSVTAWNSTSTNRSTSAKLTVLLDTNPPSVLSAYVIGTNLLEITFSEPVNPATATNIANYAITNSSGQGIVISSAVLTSPTNVLFQVVPGPGNSHFLTSRNIRDSSPQQNQSSLRSIAIGLNLQFPIDSAWNYKESDLDLGTGWKQRDFNDNSWAIGLGLFYREEAALPAPKNTPLNLLANGSFIRTFYFRKHFTLPFGFTSLAAIRHVIDDGIIVYGNGSEIHRLNMPAGAVTYATLANVEVGDAEFRGPYIALVPLITGDNVIAAEVHQATPSSGDICFGAELSLTAPSPSPIVVTDCFDLLCFSVQTNQLVLRWDVGILQNAFSLQGTNTAWQNVLNATSPYKVARSNTAAFFRLRVQ